MDTKDKRIFTIVPWLDCYVPTFDHNRRDWKRSQKKVRRMRRQGVKGV